MQSRIQLGALKQGDTTNSGAAQRPALAILLGVRWLCLYGAVSGKSAALELALALLLLQLSEFVLLLLLLTQALSVLGCSSRSIEGWVDG